MLHDVEEKDINLKTIAKWKETITMNSQLLTMKLVFSHKPCAISSRPLKATGTVDESITDSSEITCYL